MKRFLRLFLIEAKDNMEMAEIAYLHGKFSKAVYHSQQRVEKAFKAALVLKEKFISEHEVLTDFLKVYQNELPHETIEKNHEGYTNTRVSIQKGALSFIWKNGFTDLDSK